MIVAANFKMHKTRSETVQYIKELRTMDFGNVKVALFPPQSALVKDNLLGVQNAYPEINGAYTGEIGLEQLNEFDIKRILIGHSERRHILGESQEFIAKKFDFFKSNNFEIFYCIGEPLEIRKKGIAEVTTYLKAQTAGIDMNYEKLIVAYEPVWAIGTGVSAKVCEIGETHTEIRKFTTRPLLYGGSVKLSNIEEILRIENVDGVLVGGASLDVKIFKKMINKAKECK